MSSEAQLANLIQLGQDITAFKLYVISVTALWAYDYFLTLKDEVRYAWKTENILIFVLFLVTRYLPGVFQVAFAQILYYTLITAAAQIVLTQRTYAITRKNKWVTGFLYTIFTAQISVGIYMTIWSALNPAAETPKIPLDVYHLCLTNSKQSLTILQMSLSFFFDIVVFVLVVVETQLIRSRHRAISGPNILDTVSRDAEIYFAVISTSHFLIVIMFAVARPGIRSIPIVGNAALIPMMTSRMIMSLKKVASSRRTHAHMSMEVPTGMPMTLRDTYSSHPVDNIQLSVFRES
ncbi:hypothetical protein BDM02DRAFT_2718881 [Thelephora ganbajun]|uniref:Uncharacterized protein n=1 Tax=Thelephora ganbajun TaxID=370292 RepID=A0ACB6ZCK4_THEGA|nr:hypothetical protein BDM02DRAFT_2718881 [Thelephora ganbajun]